MSVRGASPLEANTSEPGPGKNAMTVLLGVGQHEVAKPVHGRCRALRDDHGGGGSFYDGRAFEGVPGCQYGVVVDGDVLPACADVEQGTAAVLNRWIGRGRVRDRGKYRLERQFAEPVDAVGDGLQPGLAKAGSLAVKRGIALLERRHHFLDHVLVDWSWRDGSGDLEHLHGVSDVDLTDQAGVAVGESLLP